MSRATDLQTTIDDIRYFVAEHLPEPGDLSLLNIRLMDLDHLLFDAKLALSQCRTQFTYMNGDPNYAQAAPSNKTELFDLLGLSSE